MHIHFFVLTPVLMKGIVKSTAVCLIEVTDMSITAMSAFCDLSSAIIPVHLVSNVRWMSMTKLVKDTSALISFSKFLRKMSK